MEAVWEGGGGTLDIPPRQDLKAPDLVQDTFKVFSKFGALQAAVSPAHSMYTVVLLIATGEFSFEEFKYVLSCSRRG